MPVTKAVCVVTKRKHRDRGYAQKRVQTLAEKHEGHAPKVAACPLCNPNAKVAGRDYE